MSCERRRTGLGILLIIAAGLGPLFGVWHPAPLTGSGVAVNNPNDFYLWGTNAAFSYTFRYDPREADLWQFRSAAAAKLVSPEVGLTNPLAKPELPMMQQGTNLNAAPARGQRR